MRVAIKIAYDGRTYHGYARQPNLKTIEGEILQALIKHQIIKDIETSNYRPASRTDKGVSALGNILAFDTDYNLNEILLKTGVITSSIIMYGIKKVEPNFNPRYAIQRIYRYYQLKEKLDIEKIQSASKLFIGSHDFSNYARVEFHRNPKRTIDRIEITEKNDYLLIDFYAQTYLWHQIRRIVSALQKVGMEKISNKEIVDALEKPNKKIDFGLASPEPLILMDVLYDFDFSIDTNLLKSRNKLEQQLYKSLM